MPKNFDSQLKGYINDNEAAAYRWHEISHKSDELDPRGRKKYLFSAEEVAKLDW